MPAKSHKIPLKFTYPLQLGIHKKTCHYATVAAHLCLAINPTTAVFITPPVIGIAMALMLILIARLTSSATSLTSVKEAIQRWLFSAIFIFLITLLNIYMTQNNLPFINGLWLVFALIQIPLSIYDAKEVFNHRSIAKFDLRALWHTR